MSEPADHLLPAVVAVVATGGYEGLSAPAVATATGVPVAEVERRFATRDALLAAAMDHVMAEGKERLRRSVSPDAPPARVLRATADELLSTGEERRPAILVWLAHLTRAAVHGPTALVHRREWQEVEDVLTWLICTARPDLAVPVARDEAGALLALLDGLTSALAVDRGRMDDVRARHLLGRHLDALLDGAARG